MKHMIYLLVLLLLIPSAIAETGAVLNASNYVQYKFDTDTLPALEPGEYIVMTEDIYTIQKNASHDGAVFTNPEPVVTPVYDDVLVETTGIDPTTAAAISALTGGGTAYLVARKRRT